MSLVVPFPEVVDSSLLAAFKQCPEMCKKVYFENWKPKEPSVHLRAGGAFAKGIEVARKAFYCGEIETWQVVGLKEDGHTLVSDWVTEQSNPTSSDEAVALGMQALLAFYGDFACPPDSAKSAERTAGALEFYFERYPLLHGECDPVTLPSGKRGIEFNFVEPLPVLHPTTGNPLLYCGRLDALLNYAGGVFMCDEKTTTQLGATWSRQWDLRSQFTGYAWGCSQAGIRPQGVIVRGVSILKTKYDTQEAISNRPVWQIDRWLKETCWWLEDMKTAWSTGRWRHNLDHACGDFGGCTFRQACSSQDETPWLDSYFERRHWNPITRVETKL